MKHQRTWINEDEAVEMIMRELGLRMDQACRLLEDSVRSGELTPDRPRPFTEAERKVWKCWRNLQ